MIKTFTLRVDLESDKGIKAVPKLLNLLKKYNIKASFYIPMGGESNILDLLRYRGRLKSAGERKIKVFSLLDKIRMILFPRDFVKSNKKILKRILKEGHELGLHGWKHREWTRGLEKINIRKRIQMAKEKYIKIFGKNPTSFASPGFNINNRVIAILERQGIRYVSDFEGKEPKYYGKIKNIPITILGENKMPIIEYWVGKRKTDKEILEIFKEDIKDKKLISFYIHGLFEARFKLDLLEEVFKFIKNKKLKNKRIIDY
jgi:peptidoglycan/xylan/chitin deacetylase (PgdA/CDA1 family)